MKRETITITNLKASEGHILTDGERYCKMVSLAQGDEGEKWYEITEEEYQAKMAEEEAKRLEAGFI